VKPLLILGKGLIQTMSKALSALALLGLVITICCLAFLQASSIVIHSPTFYQNLIQNEQVLNLGQQLLAQFGIGFSFYNADPDWEIPSHDILGAVNDVDGLAGRAWVQQTMADFIHTWVNWLDLSGTELPKFNIALDQLKLTFRSTKGVAIILPVIQSLPVCTAQQVGDMYKENGLPACKPVDGDLTGVAVRTGASISTLLPSQVSLQALYEQAYLPSTTIDSLISVRTYINFISAILPYGFRMALLFLSLYVVLSARHLRELLRSLSTAAFSSALGLLLLSGTIAGLIYWNRVLPYWSLSSAILLDPAIILFPFGLMLVQYWMRWAGWLVLVGGIILLLYFGLKWFIARGSTKNIQPEQTVRQRIKTYR